MHLLKFVTLYAATLNYQRRTGKGSIEPGMEPTKEITSIQARDPKQCCKNMTKRYQGRFWKISAEDCGQNLLDRVSVEAAVPNPFAENLSKVSTRDLHARSL